MNIHEYSPGPSKYLEKKGFWDFLPTFMAT